MQQKIWKVRRGGGGGGVYLGGMRGLNKWNLLAVISSDELVELAVKLHLG